MNKDRRPATTSGNEQGVEQELQYHWKIEVESQVR